MLNDIISNVYKKFKSYVYYDNTALHLKLKLSKFESRRRFELNLNLLFQYIENTCTSMDEKYFENLLEKINILTIPKRFQNTNNCATTNIFESDEYFIEKINYIFDGPIELHLICFYWVLKYGKVIEKYYDKYNYANILHSNSSKLNDKTYKTFKPYFKQYANWRDTGILKAQELHEKNEGSAILMLDIQSYYYSVDFNFDILGEHIRNYLKDSEYEEYDNLTLLIKRIFIKYNEQLCNLNKDIYKDQLTLPLGLSISPILANWYLHELDESIVYGIQPVYYGRYVDDIMIVLSESSYMKYLKKRSEVETKKFINYNFIENSQIFFSEGDSYVIETKKFKVVGKPKLIIESKKIKLYIMDKNGTKALLNKFVDNIRKNSSEFRFLPEENKVISEFYNDAYSMLYNDTENKLRSIENFKGNKYGVSKYLAKIIYSSKYWNDSDKDLETLIEQVDGFFKGLHSLEYYTLWEKVFTFYLINERYDKMNSFFKRVEEDIKKIIIVEEKKSQKKLISEKKLISQKKLISFLQEYLVYSLGLAASLNFKCLDEFNSKYRTRIENYAKLFRKSNLLKHNYLTIPLINYIQGANQVKDLLALNLTCSKNKDTRTEVCKNCKSCELKLDDDKLQYSPRFIHYHEFQHYSMYKEAYGWQHDYFGSYLDESKELYLQNTKYKLNIIDIEKSKEGSLLINSIKIPSVQHLDILRIGVGSIKVDGSNIEGSYLKKPNLSRERLISLFKLLNYIERENCDLIVLPEVSIPLEWLGILIHFSYKQQKALIFGVEHIINKNNYALNLLATILPFKVNELNHTFIRLRLKNHYSPEESRLLKGYRYKLPESIQMSYDLFNWNGIKFSCFNCFELADITHRAIFRSKVDFLTASEYNKDIAYFSNLAESISRDLHCYFIQSNSSDYGDSRITKPASSIEKDILRLKGGINDLISIGEIDLKSLREFQYKEFELQKEDKSFKPTPPNFDINEVEIRLKHR